MTPPDEVAFVGRAAERRRLAEALQRPGGAVVVSGPGGMGKTALVEVELAEARAQGFRTGAGKFAPSDTQSPYGPLMRALSEVLRRTLDDLYEPEAGLELLASALGDNVAVLRDAGLEGVGGPPATTAGLYGQREAQVRLQTAVLALLRWLAAFGSPTVLFIDDWTRAPSEVRAFLAELANRPGGAALHLILAQRAEPPEASALAEPVRIELHPFNEAEARALLDGLIQPRAAAECVADWLGLNLLGAPFDLVQTARALQPALCKAEGRWRIDPRAAAAIDLPNLAAQTAGALDRCTPTAQRLALAVALWGLPADRATFARALGVDASVLQTAEGELKALGLLAEQDGRLAPPHDRLREALVARLDDQARRTLARELAETYRNGRPDGLAPLPILHLRWLGGGDMAPERWRDLFAQGAARARSLADLDAANRFADTAYRLHLVQPAPTPEQAISLLSEAALASAERRDVAETADRVRALVDAAASQAALGAAYRTGILALRLAGDTDAAWRLAQAGAARFGIRLPDAAKPTDLIVPALIWRLGLGDRLGYPRRAPCIEGWTPIVREAGVMAYERSPTLASYAGLISTLHAGRREPRPMIWKALDAFLCANTGQRARAAELGIATEREILAGYGDAMPLYWAAFWGAIWTRPAAALRPRCRDVIDRAFAEGDLAAAANGYRNDITLGWRCSRSLPALTADAQAALREVERIGEPSAAGFLRAFIAMTESLMRPGARLEAPGEATAVIDSAIELEVLSLKGDWAGVLRRSAGLAPQRQAADSHLGGLVWAFHESVARLQLGRPARRRDLAFVREAARLNPTDHAGKLHLLRAEALRRGGRREAAFRHYAAAVDLALQRGGMLEAGLAARLAAEAAGEGQPERAAHFHGQYQRIMREWGALALTPAEDAGALDAVRADLAAAHRDARARSRLMAEVGHELRTPMQAIQNLLDLAAGDPSRADIPALRNVFGGLKRVVDDLTDYGAMASGGVSLHPQPTDVAALLRSERDLVQANHPGAPLTLGGAQAAPCWVMVDEGRLRQVVRNLLANAAKYAGGGRLILRTRDLADRRIAFEIAMEDDGPGLTPEDLVRVFEPFHRAGQGGEVEGMGLGLAVSRRIAAGLGGRLDAENRPEGGARFTLRFNARCVEPAEEAESVGGLVILVAEDVDLVRDTMARLLRAEGHLVVEVADGLQALERLRRDRFDLAILDLGLPGLGGTDIALRLPLDRPELIIVSAAGAEELERAGRVTGAKAVLRKPVASQDLMRAIGQAAGSARAAPPQSTAAVGAAARALADELVGQIGLQAEMGAIARTAHRLSGLAAQFELVGVAGAAEQIETLARRGEGPGLAEAAEALVAVLGAELAAMSEPAGAANGL